MSSQIYVGTYGKYNNGNLDGKWLDLEDYADKEDFHVACKELHSNESDPEFMFQTWENIPAKYIDEAWIDEEFWTDYLELDEHDRLIVDLYQSIDSNVDSETIIEKYYDSADSEADFTENYFIETCGIPEEFNRGIVIDWQATWDTNLSYSFNSVYHNGDYYFFIND